MWRVQSAFIRGGVNNGDVDLHRMEYIRNPLGTLLDMRFEIRAKGYQEPCWLGLAGRHNASVWDTSVLGQVRVCNDRCVDNGARCTCASRYKDVQCEWPATNRSGVRRCVRVGELNKRYR